eukprot:796772-Pyramimonas_sp.AAC.1
MCGAGGSDAPAEVVGSGARSEKIRTYHYNKDNRASDCLSMEEVKGSGRNTNEATTPPNSFSQVGSGARSEKIRTYNYKDNRVSDHRAKENFDLNNFMNGSIGGAIDALLAIDQQDKLEELAAELTTQL